MHPRFLPFLKCPNTNESLIIKSIELLDGDLIKSGILTNESNSHMYPILNYIPRFVSQELYSDSFGYEWRLWAGVQFEKNNVNKPMQGHTQHMFNTIVGNEKDFNQKIIAEFGCGGGRFLDRVLESNGIAIGIDLSTAVDAALAELGNRDNLLLIQADILNPPLKNDILDIAYSIGVLHHTPSPIEGMRAMKMATKKDGKVCVCVYEVNRFYHSPAVLKLRKKTSSIKQYKGEQAYYDFCMNYANWSANKIYPIFTKYRNTFLIGKIIKYLEKHHIVIVYLPDADWRKLDVFDAISPTYASAHSASEVKQWYIDLGFSNIKQEQWGGTTWNGIKQ